MYMKKATVFKVKKDRLNQWLDWCLQVQGPLYEKAVKTLEQESVMQEATFLFCLGDTNYILGFTEGECLPADMNQEINSQHRMMKQECLEYASGAEVLYLVKQGSTNSLTVKK